MELKDFMDVTILILIDGFLQYYILECILFLNDGHNPYFNRWFSAIDSPVFEFVPTNKSQSLF